MNVKEDRSRSDPYSLLKMFIKKRWFCQRLLGVMAIAFGQGMLYFGTLLGVGNLGFNTYLSVTINAILIIPFYIFSSIFALRWYRRGSILGSCITSGILSILCFAVGHQREALRVGLEIASFCTSCIAFNVLLVYAVELFPTCARNLGTSMVRQGAILGTVFDPILVSVGRKKEFFTYGIFGLTIICCGLSVFFLPETKGKPLCDTMEEEEGKHHIAS